MIQLSHSLHDTGIAWQNDLHCGKRDVFSHDFQRTVSCGIRNSGLLCIELYLDLENRTKAGRVPFCGKFYFADPKVCPQPSVRLECAGLSQPRI